MTDQQRPRLTVLLEELAAKTQQLAEASDLYQRLKAAYQSNTVPEDIGFSMTVGSQSVPIPRPDDATVVQQLEGATSLAGEQVVRLWQEAHALTQEAVAHCTAAATQQE